MRTLIHLSDIHFGKTEKDVIQKLRDTCIAMHPDLIVISGDITQRARQTEFKQAVIFINAIQEAEIPVLAIPGNHDIWPLYSPIKRLRHAYSRYNSFITPITKTTFLDDEIAIKGINTVSRVRVMGGFLSKKTLKDLSDWFSTQDKTTTRILVTHHPLTLPSTFRKSQLTLRAKWGIYAFSKARIDMYLSGHYHRSSVVPTSMRYVKEHYPAIAVQAGTVSTRSRGETPTFNVISIDKSAISVTPHGWEPEKKIFSANSAHRFNFIDGTWTEES